MKYFRKPLYLLLVISILTGMLSLQPPEPVRAASPEDAVRISQAYGGVETPELYIKMILSSFSMPLILRSI